MSTATPHADSSDRSRRLRRSQRRGTSTVQFAIVCPIFFTFFFSAIEYARVNQIVNAASFAAYQGCRRAIIPGATAANATSAAQTILSAGMVSGSTITINPSTITNTTSTVTVTVAINLDNNAWFIPTFTRGMTITRACTLTREKTN